MNIYYDKDCDLSIIQSKKVCIIGYGSQGHAHANNLQDSGVEVCVGLREGSSSTAKAEAAGIAVKSIEEGVAWADVVMVLAPDEHQAAIYKEQIEPNIKQGAAMAFAHGFNIHFGQIKPPENVDVLMIAPKGPGHMVRRVYTQGRGVPALIAIYQDYTGNAQDIGLAYAKGIGSARAGVLETTFKEETETDLFGEQTVLCGGLTELIKAGYETLVEAGYQPEVAYFECLHEVKLIADLVHEKGMTGMRDSISDTAEYGDLTIGSKIIGQSSKKAMKEALNRIQSGQFAKEWIDENDAGCPEFNKLREKGKTHDIEKVGKEVRSLFSWSKK